MRSYRRTIALVDLFGNGMMLFLACLVLVIPLINPPGSEAEETDEPPGNLSVSVIWPASMDVDIDTWLGGPAGDAPVGYSNQSGLLWNLLRDDLGNRPSDITGQNFENAYTRGVADGWYRVNLHCFRCPVVPVPVTVEVRLSQTGGSKEKTSVLFYTELELVEPRQELTAAAWRMADGKLQRGSINNLYEPLRALGRTGPHPDGDY